jgi:hypothetical protein
MDQRPPSGTNDQYPTRSGGSGSDIGNSNTAVASNSSSYGKVWISPHWKQSDQGWVWIEGYWKRDSN